MEAIYDKIIRGYDFIGFDRICIGIPGMGSW
jgi:hypothetical protein